MPKNCRACCGSVCRCSRALAYGGGRCSGNTGDSAAKVGMQRYPESPETPRGNMTCKLFVQVFSIRLVLASVRPTLLNSVRDIPSFACRQYLSTPALRYPVGRIAIVLQQSFQAVNCLVNPFSLELQAANCVPQIHGETPTPENGLAPTLRAVIRPTPCVEL